MSRSRRRAPIRKRRRLRRLRRSESRRAGQAATRHVDRQERTSASARSRQAVAPVRENAPAGRQWHEQRVGAQRFIQREQDVVI